MARLVLLVESSAAGAVARRYLWQLGYRVYRVASERDVISRARQLSPDVIMVDSRQLCRVLKLQPDLGDRPVVLLDTEPEFAGPRIEPDATLSFPITCETLDLAIRRALDLRLRHRVEGIVAELDAWIPSDTHSLAEFHDLLPNWLTGCGLTYFQVRQTNLAVREVVANAIEWGHGYVRSRLVRVECMLDDEKVAILVRDNGPGFDRGNLPHAARPGDPLSHLRVRADRRLREGGFGILHAYGLVDLLCYSESGNEGLLIKYLPLRASRPARSESFSLFPAI